ncbi:hypothetical protein XCR1_4250012 [Xenorhabdus cabanillasii JM26]|uniref:Uncharacterized protein n=1 Tax=Xenorhabdus cabanillasii JM26 TaxID=1427517 RepID=W1J7A8_9GAMM|nr:hypothetical protein XCR1_4250012 [Xenorhabdus cabanillasii JM26]
MFCETSLCIFKLLIALFDVLVMGNMINQNNTIAAHSILDRGIDHDYFRFN